MTEEEFFNRVTNDELNNHAKTEGMEVAEKMLREGLAMYETPRGKCYFITMLTFASATLLANRILNDVVQENALGLYDHSKGKDRVAHYNKLIEGLILEMEASRPHGGLENIGF